MERPGRACPDQAVVSGGLAGAHRSKVSGLLGLQDKYSVIAARAKAEGAKSSWADETAVSSVEHYARGDAPRGKTPVLVLSQSKRCRINLISAVTNQGTLRFMLYREKLDADMFIKFLKRLHKDAEEPVRTPGAIQSKLLGHLRSLQKQWQRIRSYFKNEKIRYAV